MNENCILLTASFFSFFYTRQEETAQAVITISHPISIISNAILHSDWKNLRISSFPRALIGKVSRV